jgi:hypothetical protein
MGTRGFVGVVVDGNEKLNYQQYDSYPDGVGVRVLAGLKRMLEHPDALLAKARALTVVPDDTKPTPEQVKALTEFTDLGVSEQSTDDWYCLLRGTQGDLELTLAAGFVEDNSGFPLDSLFCEWGYLADLDAQTFEVYQGFQSTVPENGRWAGRPTVEEDKEAHAAHVVWCLDNGRDPWMPKESEYKAVERVACWPLDDLPDEAAFLAHLQPAEVEA